MAPKNALKLHQVLLRLLVLVALVAVVSVAFFDDSSSVPVTTEKATPPSVLARSAADGAELKIGGTYFTFDAGYLSAEDAGTLRRGLEIGGADRQHLAKNEAQLARLGLEVITGRHKVQVIETDDHGALVRLRALETGQAIWTVAAAVATPYRDQAGKPILVGGAYVAAEDALGATTVDGVGRALEAVAAATSDEGLIEFLETGDSSRADAEHAKAFAKVAKTKGVTAIKKGQRLVVVDFDIDDTSAVKVRLEGSSRELWVYATSLAVAGDRLPAAER